MHRLLIDKLGVGYCQFENILYISLSFRVGRGNNDFWRNHADNHFPKFADDNDDDLCEGDNDER